ncbi:MAG: YdbH domain-containing protein [Mariprofundaceae bacterium]|nr:YdbH domain-containing protein [Mariprofundaceae bacterium]
MLKSPYKSLCWIIVISLVSLLSLYVFSHTLSHKLIHSALHQAGFYNISLSSQRPNLTSWTIPSLRAENKQFSFHFQHIALHYSISSLLSGKIQQLHIQQAHVRLLKPSTSAINNTKTTPSTSSKPSSKPSSLSSLPARLWLDLPISQLDIQQFTLDIYATPALHLLGEIHMDKQQLQAQLTHQQLGQTNISIHTQLHRSGKLEIRITNHEQDILSLHMQLDAKLETQQQHWFIQGKADIHIQPLLRLLNPWLALEKPLQTSGNMQAQWQIKLPLQQPLQNFSASIQTSGYMQLTAANLPLQHIRAGLQSSLTCKHTLCDWQFLEQNQLTAHLATPSTPIPIHINIATPLQGKISWLNQLITASIQSGKLALSPIQHEQFSSQTIHVQPRIAVKKQGDKWSLQPSKIQAEIEAVTWQENTFSTPSLLLYIHQQGKQIQAYIHSKDVLFRHFDNQSIHSSIDLHIQNSPQYAKADLHIQTINPALHIQANLSQQWQQMSGKLNITLQPFTFSNDNNLAQLFSPTPAWGIHAGTANINSAVHWRQGKVQHHQSRVQLQALAGHVKDTYFSNLNTDLQLYGDAQHIQSQPSSYLHIQHINAQLPMQNVRSNITFSLPFNPTSSTQNKPQLQLSQFHIGLLGGNITAPTITIDLNKQENPFQVHIEHIDLNKIMELRQQDDIYASGSLSGKLPFRWTKQGLILVDGILKTSKKGGIIRYQPDDSVHRMAADNSSVQVILDAFGNFHYQTLQSTLNYQPNGLMLAHIRLSGSNPDFHQGQSIQLNLNIEENILQLIRSLQIAGKVGDKLDERVQKSWQK